MRLFLLLGYLCLCFNLSVFTHSGEDVTTDHLFLDMIYLKDPLRPDEKGNQLLHFRSKNKNPLTNDKSGETAAYVQKNLKKSKVFYSDAEILRYAVDEAGKSDGLFLEFGVAVGKTTNFIAALIPFRTLHGFDSFCGLQATPTSAWAEGECAFKKKGELPPLLSNVLLQVGYFEDTLPGFKKKWLKDTQIAFMNIDCDLYESTVSIFKHLGDNIRAGTIIVFDEYFGYKDWQNQEFRGFQEWIALKGVRYEYLAYNAWHQQVVVRIIK